MPDQPKIAFQLTAHGGSRLEVRVQTAQGEARGESTMPAPALADMLAERSARGKMNAKLVDRIGSVLYKVLISPSVDELVYSVLHEARGDGIPVLFELRFDTDQVALTRYPWEMICNPEGEFLVRDGLVDVTRYVTYPQPPPAFDDSITGMPLFRVISTPADLPVLSTPPLGINPVETLEHASFETFSQRLLIDRLPLWGLHFDGHGALALQCGRCDTLNGPAELKCWNCGKSLAGSSAVGALAFEKNGAVAWVTTRDFGSVLYNTRTRLAVLLACETASVGGKVLFSGLAPGLMLAGVPAVIGMQYPVLDSFAGNFASQFYTMLVKDNDIVGAMRAARRMNVLDAWYSPALYLRRQPSDNELAKQSVYLTRNIDTAAPARVAAGATFLTRLWIRRPETKPLSPSKLRAELDIPTDVPVKQSKGEAEVKFEQVEGRKLRRGEVEVSLSAVDWDVTPHTTTLFIDETLDAPPAIFTVKARTQGKQPLVFSVSQDGGVIHTVTHVVEALDEQKPIAALPEVIEHSEAINVEKKKKAPAAFAPPARQPSAQRRVPAGLIAAGSVAAIGLAAVIGIAVFGPKGGAPTATAIPTVEAPTHTVSVPVTQPDEAAAPQIPQPLSPNGDKLFCGREVVFNWTESPDPASIDTYEVEIQDIASQQWQTVGVNRYPHTAVAEMLQCPLVENSYRWRVRAWSLGGVASDWSDEVEFILYVPENPSTDTALEPLRCEPGWLPTSGCDCCATTLVCADGTVATFNPECGVKPYP